MHYSRWLRGGKKDAAVRGAEILKHGREPGYVVPGALPNGRRMDEDGYIMVHGRPEHRVVMEQYLGRPLLRDETVHHKNGDRGDNTLSNLELWSHSQPYGQRVIDKLDWARKIIARYGTEVTKLSLFA